MVRVVSCLLDCYINQSVLLLLSKQGNKQQHWSLDEVYVCVLVLVLVFVLVVWGWFTLKRLPHPHGPLRAKLCGTQPLTGRSINPVPRH